MKPEEKDAAWEGIHPNALGDSAPQEPVTGTIRQISPVDQVPAEYYFFVDAPGGFAPLTPAASGVPRVPITLSGGFQNSSIMRLPFDVEI